MDVADSAESTWMLYEAGERDGPCPPIYDCYLPRAERGGAIIIKIR